MDREYEFSEGDAVRIRKGAFASFLGSVLTVDNRNQRLTVAGRFEGQPDSELHALNVSFRVVEKLGTYHCTETILIVEADETARNLVHEILEDCGYHVLNATNGMAALSISALYEKSIDLLLADVVMPEMSGRELAERLAQLRPEIKILYMSGYTDDVIVHHGLLDEGINFIEKPFTPDALARKVREVLDGRGEPLKQRK